MAKKSKKATRTYLSVNGIPEMVDRIEKVFGDAKEPLARAYKKGMENPEMIIKEWFDVLHCRTGRTFRSYYDGRLVWQKDGYAVYRYGFDRQKGGLTAVFFEYGTPRIKPEFVMYYAVHDYIDVIESELMGELMSIARKKGLVE